MLVSARGTVKPCLTNDCRHLAKWGEVHFISTRADCFIMLSPLDNTMWVCTKGWFWGQTHRVISCQFWVFFAFFAHIRIPASVSCRGPGVHLFCSPLMQLYLRKSWVLFCLVYLLHTFTLRPRAFFLLLPLLDSSPGRQCKASQCCNVASRHKLILWWAGEVAIEQRPRSRFL